MCPSRLHTRVHNEFTLRSMRYKASVVKLCHLCQLVCLGRTHTCAHQVPSATVALQDQYFVVLY
jgi:hypothetical protein